MYAKGFCHTHYVRWKKYGDASIVKTAVGGEKRDWAPILAHAAEIVRSYDTSVTLRQLHYRLVASGFGGYLNNESDYHYLSTKTAAARDDGLFPDLIDPGRVIRELESWSSPADALSDAERYYRRDRTEGQPYQLFLAVEKTGLVEQLSDWFDGLGIPILAFKGRPSQTYRKRIERRIRSEHRPAVLLYAGDFDASGIAIYRDFVSKTAGSWETTRRVALNAEQISEFDLSVNEGKSDDPNTVPFMEEFEDLHEEHGFTDSTPLQIEVDAIDPNDLHALFQTAIDDYWDVDAATELLEEEANDKRTLSAMIEHLEEEAS